MGRTSPFRCEGVKVQNRRSAADTPVSGGWLKLPRRRPSRSRTPCLNI